NETLHGILSLPAVIGIKVATLDSVMTFQRVAAVMREHPDKLLITGEDRFLGYSLMMGARAALIGMGAALTELQASLLRAVALGGLMPKPKQPHIVVVGAGAFGGWTALFLRRQGARVTLLDAWGPGNSRASSGGETRVIRATYGPRAVYTRMAARALTLWKE